MTLSELREEVRSMLDEEDTTGFFRDSEIDQWLNEGYYDIAANVKHIKETAFIKTEPTYQKYQLPDNFIEMFKVFLNGEVFNKVPLEYKGKKEGYYIWEDDICFSTSAPDNGTLEIYYYRKPIKPLEFDEDEPEMPSEYQHLLINYALYRSLGKDSNPAMSQYFYQEYLRGIANMKSKFMSTPSKNTITVRR